MVERGDSLAIDLVRQNLEHKASKRYKGCVVSRLKIVPNEAVKCNAFAHEEEVQKSPHWYIENVKSPDGHMLLLNCEMHGAFRSHFHDRYVRPPDLPVQEFHSYLADFPFLEEVEAASCKGLVTECEVHEALKQVSLNKLPGLDGLSYEVYLRMSHVCPLKSYNCVQTNNHHW